MTYKNYIFDLDGTLTDPGLGIKNSIRYSLNKAGLPIPPESILNEFIGPPLINSYKLFCGANDEEAKTLVALYREYFSVKGYLENTLFPETPQVLSHIKMNGRKIFLATSKPEEYALKILEHFDILKYFDFCSGNDLSESRPTKTQVLAHLIAMTGISSEESVMVGDRKYDIDGASAFGIPTAAVLNGYGSPEELAGAKYILNDLSGLLHV